MDWCSRGSSERILPASRYAAFQNTSMASSDADVTICEASKRHRRSISFNRWSTASKRWK
jgi:hypothetical protein